MTLAVVQLCVNFTGVCITSVVASVQDAVIVSHEHPGPKSQSSHSLAVALQEAVENHDTMHDSTTCTQHRKGK
jgi:hypothetical protein